ncbi:type I methionyl aminopeptidase [Streptomyces sp. DH24]|uniref:type I methionyl aminopeptidase n=1 Tax=Streptomyces sp. DH24 TaxID=3040123 RepID=UPI0024437047|nr:type I methionyl aminopeptidase [Streptomyces sp. DH24]MDG9717697.1 type I methionyl aminopeptidase [Streptomyces sp. DH24]
MVELKTDTSIDAMHAAGQVVGRALTAVRQAADVGVSLLELDALAHEVLREAGASSPFLGYRPSFALTPFPAVLCTSVNDAVVHGVPTAYRLRDGDLLSVDFGAELDGWVGDSAISLVVGTPRPADLRLIETAERALAAGIEAAVVGNRIGDIAHAIGSVCRGAGYGLMEDFGGHGVGRRMHEDPPVPNEGRPGRGLKLRHGMVLAIEPMLIAGGTDAYHTAPDGWTLCTNDGSRAAHVEHTVAITHAGPRILTARQSD